MFVGDASFLDDSASFLEDNVSMLEINASLFEDNEPVFVDDASLLKENASFSLGSEAVASFRARLVEARAPVGEVEGAPARARVTLRRARAALAKRNDRSRRTAERGEVPSLPLICLSAQGAISFDERGRFSRCGRTPIPRGFLRRRERSLSGASGLRGAHHRGSSAAGGRGSVRSIFPRCRRSSASAVRTRSNTPSRSHFGKRSWQFWYGG